MNPNQNSLPELIEVIMRVVKSNEDDSRDVRTELRVHAITLEADGCMEFQVELDRAHLSLDLDGFEVIPKTRHGEPTKTNNVAVEHKLTKEQTREGQISVGIEANLGVQPSGSASGKMSGSAGAKQVHSMSAQQTHTLLRVKARGNLSWEITEPLLTGGTKSLDDTYLNDDVLCKIRALPGANRLAVKLAAFARKRDIKVTPRSKLGVFVAKSKNHEKMLNAVIAKAISHKEANGGVLTFSVSEIVVEEP